jgi:predicted O-methyltransferase YrrM
MQELEYIHPPTRLALALERTAEIRFPMASEIQTGALLRTLAASKPAGRFLELGTGTGIASTWLLDGMDAASVLISVDNNPDYHRLAREAAGADPRLTLVTEDAIAFLQRQSAAGFDLVFADAMAGKYESLDLALQVVKPGGFYVVDDLLPQPNWPDGHAQKVPCLIAELAAHPEFTMVPLAWATGYVVAVRRTPA